MPNKLTDAEVKKALEEAIEYGCGHYVEIELSTIKDVLDLINRQDQENESLKAEVERLKEDIKILRVSVEQAPLIRKDGKSPLSLLTAEIKAEAYKECVEVVKKLWGNYSGYEFEKKINNLLNELVGDGDGKDS